MMNEVLTDLSPGIKFLNRFAQYDNKMQLSTALTLLYIASRQDEGVTTQDLQKWLGLSSASASRNTYYWGEGTPDMPHAGYGLIDVAIDPGDRRRRILRLTPRGEAFVNQLKEELNG